MERSYFATRPLPKGLEGLSNLALDLRWSWSHFSDRLWEYLDSEAWERTGNPYFILESVSQHQLEAAARDAEFRARLDAWLEQRQAYLDNPGWYGQHHPDESCQGMAYFSMEFGLTEALPIYSGGLGILAGDHLKAASDLGVPLVGVGLLYQQGYFRQMLSPDYWQLEAFPYNDPISLPIMPVQNVEGGWLRIQLAFPGRMVFLRVWKAQVGKVTLLLLDSNDPLNSPRDRSITANLYPGAADQRLMQEFVLGVGGWKALQALGHEVEVCHLNEGHAAFVTLARAHSVMLTHRCPFPVAWWAARAGNVFTSHTPVEAAFDRFSPSLIRPYLEQFSSLVNMPVEDLFALGRKNPSDHQEPFNMAYLAMRGSCTANGVSRLHGQVSRTIFQPMFPRWPAGDVPIRHITNGVHIPSWDSPQADDVWTRACGKKRWVGTLEELCDLMGHVKDEDLWALRLSERTALVQYVRRRLSRQLQEHGASAHKIQETRHVLDPNALTIGFARRFTAYKRPTLLLHDPQRLAALLTNSQCPIQIVVAGKAHPQDEVGKRLVQAMAKFSLEDHLLHRLIFLEDYEMGVAQELVAGIDVWLNTPRRPWEACGTSGMKVLVNGGINLSVLDGWWDEAYTPQVGWALGDGGNGADPAWDAKEASQLYDILEHQVIPEFYDRDAQGIPRQWVQRVRHSMSHLTPQFSSNRMVREYVEQAYLTAAKAYRQRTADGASAAKDLAQWEKDINENWGQIRIVKRRNDAMADHWQVTADIYFGELPPTWAKVELYAEPLADEGPLVVSLDAQGAVPGLVNVYQFSTSVPHTRPIDHYTLRMVPFHPQVHIPQEMAHILWER